MLVSVTIGIADPDAVDLNSVEKELPYGKVTVHATQGGLDVRMKQGMTAS